MPDRRLLVALLVAATAAFVVGVSVEQSSGDTHTDAHVVEPSAGAEGGEAHSEAAEGHDAGTAVKPSKTDESSSETVLGIDVEATPFVALAAVFSLALAAAVWFRPRSALLLGAVAVAMVAFVALDVREVVHQLDESKGGVALLAALVAALHLSAAAVAALMCRSASRAGGDALA